MVGDREQLVTVSDQEIRLGTPVPVGTGDRAGLCR
jgi:hypothetical protein